MYTPGRSLVYVVYSAVRAVVRLIGHHLLILVRYEGGKLIYTHCHMMASHALGRCVVQTARVCGI